MKIVVYHIITDVAFKILKYNNIIIYRIYMATNTDLVNLNNTLKTFYNSYISDNKYYLNYLADITNKSLTDENKFNRKIQQLFLLNINNVTTLIIDKTNPDSLIDEGLGPILNDIIMLLESFNIFITTDNDFVKKYNKIGKITIVVESAAGTISADNLTLKNNFTLLTANTFNKNGNTNLAYVNIIDNLNNKETIIKNLIYYLLNMTQFNIKIQVNAILGYYKLVKHYYNIYKSCEKIMFTRTVTNDICDEIKTEITSTINDANEYILVENFVEKFTVSAPATSAAAASTSAAAPIASTSAAAPAASTSAAAPAASAASTSAAAASARVASSLDITVDGKIISQNPLTVEIIFDINLKDYVDKTFLTEYVLVIDSQRIPIVSYTATIINASSFKITFILHYNYEEYSSTATNLSNTAINTVLLTRIDKKKIEDLKKEFVFGGEQLKGNNINIENYRKNINKTVNIFKRNEERLNILNIQLNIYYCIYGIIIFALIGLANYPMLNRTKQIIVLAIIVIVILMIVINYFIQSRYIEEFKENFYAIPSCNSLVSTYDKINFIQNSINTFLPQSKLYMNNLMVYLPTLDTFDLYKQLTNSIKKERKSFNNIEKHYYNKEKEATEYTQLLNQQVLNKSSYIFLISYIFLVISLVYLSYLIIPDYIKLFLFIGLLFVIFILWIYIYNIVDIVRTNSYNKYWIKPSNQTISDLGAK